MEQQYDKEQWIAKKKAEREQVFSDIQSTLPKVSVDSNALRSFLDICSRFDQYTLNNQLLVFNANPNAKQVKEYKQWDKQSIHVNKGEKGFLILKPYQDKNGKFQVNTVTVFDVKQTDSNKEMKHYIDIKKVVEALVSISPCDILKRSDMADSVDSKYEPTDKKIYIKSDLGPNSIVRCLSKEIAHAIKDKESDKYERGDYAIKAYMLSYMLCSKYGIDVSNYNFDKASEIINAKSEDEKKVFLSELSSMNKHMNKGINEYLYKDKNRERNDER